MCDRDSGCAYAASKHGLRGWSLSCYQNLREHNIKVVLINPGTCSLHGGRGSGSLVSKRMVQLYAHCARS